MRLAYIIPTVFALLNAGVKADDLDKTLSIYGLSTKVWKAGENVTFQASWVDRPGLIFKTDLDDWKLNAVHDDVANKIIRAGRKYHIKSPAYGTPNEEGWFPVTFPLPNEMKSGKYYLLWETKIMGDNKVQSKDFNVNGTTVTQSQEERHHHHHHHHHRHHHHRQSSQENAQA